MSADPWFQTLFADRIGGANDAPATRDSAAGHRVVG